MIIRPLLYMLLACAMVLHLYACSSASDIVFPDKEGEKLPVAGHHYVLFSNNISYSAVATRSLLNQRYLPQNYQVGIFALKSTKNPDGSVILPGWSSENMSEYFNNSLYVSDGPSKRLRTLSQIKPEFPAGENSALVFCAYGSYNSQLVYDPDMDPMKGPTLPIVIDPHVVGTEDYIYTGRFPVACKNMGDQEIELPFKHALARLDVKIMTKDQFADFHCPVVKKIKVITKTSQGGTLDLETGKISQTGSGNNTFIYDCTDDPIKIVPHDTPNSTVSFLFIPENAAIMSVELEVIDENGYQKSKPCYQFSSSLDNGIDLRQNAITTLEIEYGVKVSIIQGSLDDGSVNGVLKWDDNDDSIEIEH